MKNEELDRFIFRTLEKSETEIPAKVRDNVRIRISAIVPLPRPITWKRIAVWTPLLAAALLVLAVSLPLLFTPKPVIKEISQIRTEFSIPEKNIKIIWIQRDNFHLLETKG
ncbi:MAG: hypothetical protein NTZ12_11660 [Candidatus Aminicenantes bacterium]|nr:hypothetical protein [Candidatus Aminicenantes bacterium]